MRLGAVLSLVVFALPAFGAEPAQKARDYVDTTLRAWASDPAIVAAILDQNTRTSGLAQADIDQLDKDWRANLGKGASPMIDDVIASPASDILRAQVETAGGIVTEVFVMDAKGLNVAASAATSDYWQGDEAKFTETFPKGPDAVHVGEVEFDESAQTYQVQVSFPVLNPADGTTIGAITIALDAEQL